MKGGQGRERNKMKAVCHTKSTKHATSPLSTIESFGSGEDNPFDALQKYNSEVNTVAVRVGVVKEYTSFPLLLRVPTGDRVAFPKLNAVNLLSSTVPPVAVQVTVYVLSLADTTLILTFTETRITHNSADTPFDITTQNVTIYSLSSHMHSRYTGS